jgi:hypothetical protein
MGQAVHPHQHLLQLATTLKVAARFLQPRQMQGKPHCSSPQPLSQGSSKAQFSRRSQLLHQLQTSQQQSLQTSQQQSLLLVRQRLALTL